MSFQVSCHMSHVKGEPKKIAEKWSRIKPFQAAEKYLKPPARASKWRVLVDPVDRKFWNLLKLRSAPSVREPDRNEETDRAFVAHRPG